jgi:hypothetical protein
MTGIETLQDCGAAAKGTMARFHKNFQQPAYQEISYG